jgi:ABC-type glycerol-3-phosphate transport system substrate-binding protein
MKRTIAILILLGLAACSSLEPRDGAAKSGDKTWRAVHAWYNPKWSPWVKAAYWIGPGH